MTRIIVFILRQHYSKQTNGGNLPENVGELTFLTDPGHLFKVVLRKKLVWLGLAKILTM